MVYYYSDGQQQIGPISKDELKLKGITKETLVWREGLSEWTKAGEVEDLADLFPKIPTPPPIPGQKKVAPPPMPGSKTTTPPTQNQSVENTTKEMVFNGKLFVLINFIAVCFGALMMPIESGFSVFIVFVSFCISLILGFVKKVEKPVDVVFNRNIFIVIAVIGVVLSIMIGSMIHSYNEEAIYALLIGLSLLCGWIAGILWKIPENKIWKFKGTGKVLLIIIIIILLVALAVAVTMIASNPEILNRYNI